jgi:hypothetical protein
MKKLAIANGKYIKDGVEKTRWVNIGTINTTAEGKEYMLLDPTINLAAFPREIGKDMLMVGIFEQQPQQQGQNNQNTSAQSKPNTYNTPGNYNPNNYGNYQQR